MEPTLTPGQIVIASTLKPARVGEVVVAQLVSGREVIKRLQPSVRDGQKFSLVGDNQQHSSNYSTKEIADIYGGIVWPIMNR